MNASDHADKTALNITAKAGDPQVVACLVAAPDIELDTVAKPNRWTPLAATIHLGVVRILLATRKVNT